MGLTEYVVLVQRRLSIRPAVEGGDAENFTGWEDLGRVQAHDGLSAIKKVHTLTLAGTETSKKADSDVTYRAVAVSAWDPAIRIHVTRVVKTVIEEVAASVRPKRMKPAPDQPENPVATEPTLPDVD